MNSPRGRILVVDDEANVRRVLCAMLRRAGYEVRDASDGEVAIAALREAIPDTIITDLRMPRLDGMGLLRHVLSDYSDVPVIIITAHGSLENAVEAVKAGAHDYIEKPWDNDKVREVVEKAVATRRARETDARPAVDGAPGVHHGMIGESQAMRSVYDVIAKAANSPTTVLITGESGTGKNLVAHALHANSDRRKRPFITINCAAIPDDLLESELFGYEKGAFTGAVSSKQGRVALAADGTLFLDEIGELPTYLQTKLLRVIQDGQFEPVGGLETVTVDVRLIAATNKRLSEMVENGSFREDLYYRLNVVNVEMPSLRERTEDIPLLIDHFLSKFNRKLARSITGLDTGVREQLAAYHWPGNIREFENIIERAVLFADGDRLRLQDLPEGLRPDGVLPTAAPVPFPARIRDTAGVTAAADTGGTGMKQIVRAATTAIERDLIEKALKETAGNVTHAARKLGISRKSLQIKMKELGLRGE